jgi:adenosylmethionine-8-amino-7-oxononanoate aminotransferase
VNLHGHRKREIDHAIQKQLRKIAHSTLLGQTHPSAVRLSERLVRQAHRSGMTLDHVFYSDNGSTAVEVALKMAVQYWQLKGRPSKSRFLGLVQAYHGDTVGAISVGAIDLFHARFGPLLFPTFKAGSPHCYRCFLYLSYPSCRLACAGDVERILESHHDSIAGVIVEPLVQGAAGMIVWPDGYLGRIRALCTKYNVLMIADEVLTGFGRTGKMFACEHENVSPDFLALAKGITGGYLPLAATLTTHDVYQAFLGAYGEFKTFFHGHSYTGNPLACAAALANLSVFEREKTLQRLQPKIEYLKRLLTPLRSHPHVGDIRQRGFIVGIELVADRETAAPYPLTDRIGHRVARTARRLGLLIRPLGNVVPLIPPLSTTRKELQKMVTLLVRSIEEACSDS